MPMGVLDEASANNPRYRCERCELKLALSCFVKSGGEKAGTRARTSSAKLRRWSLCRLCGALARKNQETGQRWLDV
ncbi:hypothetical protein BD309DRAFT_969318 [Dichomitus squalens]|nr:hypothetical protein BD309DRAFT_969318 [Dichomitus squalens]